MAKINDPRKDIKIRLARNVLEKYKEYYPKTTAESGYGLSSPKLTFAPNHPVVVSSNLDKPILKNMNADVYCAMCEMIIDQLKYCDGVKYGFILERKYITLDPMTDDQIRHMLVTKYDIQMQIATYYRCLNRALYYFGTAWPSENHK